ncbi:DUF4157 domain-containing protein [Kitasatospora sp. NPDC052896]|uniref:eCIS core domain-containing protein n=1 Tax=Kitasatospora sp. NPDC052896 TaxID=3364061 RepID=UPI0037C5CC58
MRTYGSGRSGDERADAPPAAARGQGAVGQLPGLTSTQGILALQSAVGNAAVVQTLRQAGHLPEEHQHGAGCGHEQPVQRSAVHDVLRGGGKPLDETTRTDMESRLGADFSDVRIHDDSAARASAAEVGARAYTSGSHVVIGDGGGDKHTLAHELTHVIQQRQGPVAGTDNGGGLKVSDPSDRFEREAEANATRAMSAAPVQRSTDEAGGRPHTPEAGVVQRMPTVPAAVAGTQAQQQDQLDYLVAFYVPAETFSQDGDAPPAPQHAYLSPQAGDDVEVLRVQSAFQLPRAAGRRGEVLQTSWPARYQSSFFAYEIELINDPTGQTSQTLIDPGFGFRVTNRVARGSGGRSGGRTYAFGDRWGLNPGAQGWNGVPPAQQLATAEQDFGLDPDGYMTAQDAQQGGFTPLPLDPDQPFVFFVHPGRHDPKFLDNNRRFMNAAGFDNLGQLTREATGLSQRPQVDRRDGQRGTATAMANTQAHQWMGQGNGGAVGQLAKYEWCHLIGDGDGGPSIPANLVIGTNAVNTEQLAMEIGLREEIPLVQGRNHDIRLRVTAAVERAPEEPANPPARLGLPDQLQADWISYEISLVPRGQVNGPQTPVHRQIMDAKRGTITESEFVALRATVKQRIRATVAQLP